MSKQRTRFINLFISAMSGEVRDVDKKLTEQEIATFAFMPLRVIITPIVLKEWRENKTTWGRLQIKYDLSENQVRWILAKKELD